MSVPQSTTEVRSEHAFDVTRLESYLRTAIKGFSSVQTIRQFSSGQSNPTFYIRSSGGEEYVLRKKPPGKLLPSAHAVEREYRVMDVLKNTDVPVPTVLCLCTSSDVIGTPFYVMKYVKGRIFDDGKLSEVSKEERRAIYNELADVLAKIHNLDYNKLGLNDFGSSTDNYFSRQVTRWSQQYKDSKTKEIPEMDKLMEWLPKHIPDHQESRLVHGDYRLNNVIFDPVAPKIIAVLDWELSTIGHPYSDLGYFVSMYNFPQQFHGGLAGANLKNLNIPTPGEFIAEYCKRRGIKRIKDFHFYIIFSLFRSVGITQGVAKRALLGNASSTTASMIGSLASFIAEKAWIMVLDSDPFLQTFEMFPFSPSLLEIRKKVLDFMDEFIYPNEKVYEEQLSAGPSRWIVPPIMEELKKKARAVGLWNLFHPPISKLTNLDYAPLCEIMGRSIIAAEVFNCSAPDTGNMEVLDRYGTEEQKKKWLEPLLNGEIRSAFCMTEPEVASSDANNIQTSIVRDGNEYVINGRKWWSSGAGDPRCKLGILMGKSDPNAPMHKQQSMILVDLSTPGIKILRHLPVFGYDDAPHGHMEIEFKNVRVPAENMILGEGRGFEIAQGRLGPGRIHHCMRLIGIAERCLEALLDRASNRIAFGKPLFSHATVQQDIAKSRMEIDQARLLVYRAAHAMDTRGNKFARDQIAMIKVVVPQMTIQVIDRAIQVYGAAGFSNDFLLARAFAGSRTLRVADGPDAVHERTVAQIEYQKFSSKL